MMAARNRCAEVCSRVGVFGALLLLVLALGMRAQDAKGAGTSSAPERPTTPETAAPTGMVPATPSTDDSTATSSSTGTKTTKPMTDATIPTPAAAQAKPTLADFAWLAGRWQGVWGPRIAQQVWMPPKGGVMLGMFQTVDNGATLVIELFAIVERPNGISLYFRHFTPTLEPWETSKATLLRLASSTPKAIEFDNPVNGQPKRAIIRKIDADTYVSRSEIVPDKGGDTQIVEITYHRQKVAAPAKH
jgi:Domain of unknown function (DUF6265)